MPLHLHPSKTDIYLDTREVYGIDNDFYLHQDSSNGQALIIARWGNGDDCAKAIPLAQLPSGGQMSALAMAARFSYNHWNRIN